MQPQYVQGGGQPQYVVAQPQYYAQAPQQQQQQQQAYAGAAPPGYYQQQPQQPQQYYPQQPQVVMGQPVQQEIVVIETQQPQHFGGFSRDAPAMCVCPNCRQTISTNVSTEPGAQTWFCVSPTARTAAAPGLRRPPLAATHAPLDARPPPSSPRSASSLALAQFCILLLLFWPAACLPFCIPSCQDVTHSCPACGVVVTRISG